MAGWATLTDGLGARLIRFGREPLSARIAARWESVRGVQWIVLPLVLWRRVVRSSSGCFRCRERWHSRAGGWQRIARWPL